MAKTPAQRAEERAKIAKLPRTYVGSDEEGWEGEAEKRQARIEGLKDAILAPPDPAGDAYDRMDKEVVGRAAMALLDEADTAMLGILGMMKRRIAGNVTAPMTVRAYLELRDIKDKVKEWEKAVSDLVDAYGQLAYARIEGEQLANVRLDNGRGVTNMLEPYTKVEDKAKLRAWIEERNPETGEQLRPDLVAALTLHWGRLNSLAKEMLMAGEEPPPGTSLWSRPKVRLLS